MSNYQQCPVCNGTGLNLHMSIVYPNSTSSPCTVCDGKKIISSLTGKPPLENDFNSDINSKHETQKKSFNKQ